MSVGNNIDIIGKIHNCTEDEILLVFTNGGSNNLTKIVPLKNLPLDIQIYEYYMENILSLKGVAYISGVHITMYSNKERYIIADHRNK